MPEGHFAHPNLCAHANADDAPNVLVDSTFYSPLTLCHAKPTASVRRVEAPFKIVRYERVPAGVKRAKTTTPISNTGPNFVERSEKY